MEKIDFEAELFVEEAGARRDIPHQQNRDGMVQRRRAGMDARSLGCVGCGCF